MKEAMEPILVIPERLQPILDTLQRLEPIFHAAHAEATPENVEQYVSPRFWEVGASGNRYSRDFALKVLAERQKSPDIAAWKTAGWHIAEAGTNTYLLTYTLYQPDRITRRLSVWQKQPAGWQVIYHQGTMVQNQ